MKKDGSLRIERIGNLFETYRKRLRPPQSSVEKECIRVIEKLTKIQLSEEQVTYTVSTKTIQIQAPSVLKSELQFRYSEIITELKKELGSTNAPTTII